MCKYKLFHIWELNYLYSKTDELVNTLQYPFINQYLHISLIWSDQLAVSCIKVSFDQTLTNYALNSWICQVDPGFYLDFHGSCSENPLSSEAECHSNVSLWHNSTCWNQLVLIACISSSVFARLGFRVLRFAWLPPASFLQPPAPRTGTQIKG